MESRRAPVWNENVAKLSPLIHDARRLSDGHVDGVEAAWHRVDAVAAAARALSQTISQKRSETARNQQRDHPLHRKMEPSRADGVRKVNGRRKRTASIMSDVAVPANRSFR